MRTIEYLSPSALAQFESNREVFYLQRLSEFRKPRPSQEIFMGVGSGFDAFVKSKIYADVIGDPKGTKFEFETLFEEQVEPHNRDEVLDRARDLWIQYIECGAYGHLLADIVKSPYQPQLEFTVKGEVQGEPLLGKPDLRYVTAEGVHVIADWKVNGSTSNTGASPVQGYQICRDYGSKTNGEAHKKYTAANYKDVEVNQTPLEEFSRDWATQLSIYAWLLGEPVGSQDFVVRMEQLACRPVKKRDLPRVKVATHMAHISPTFQAEVMLRVKSCWEAIRTEHIFTDLGPEESRERCELLDMQAQVPPGLHPALACCFEESVRFAA